MTAPLDSPAQLGQGEGLDCAGGITRAIADLRAVGFELGQALLLVGAGYGVVGMVPVLPTDFPSGWQVRTL